MFLDEIVGRCEEFLCTYFGKDGTQNDSPNRFRALGLRLICLGNPERAVQGELLHYLRASNVNAVSECGLIEHRPSPMKPGRRRLNPDITVFDADWKPQCVIELKHFAANQGTVRPLVSNMQEDLLRHTEGPLGYLPIIRIGLYTEIHEIGSSFPDGLYRFPQCYCRRRPTQKLEEQRIPSDVGERMNCPPEHTRFTVGDFEVVGRVGWILHASSPETRADRGPVLREERLAGSATL